MKLRDLIVSKAGNDNGQYKNTTPSHIQEKVDKRIASELKKKPGLTAEKFDPFSEKLKYFDLFEYFEYFVTKANWSHYEPMFVNKEQLQNRFNQLSTLRNCIRHSREVSAIEKLDGEAAITWFNHIIK
jgi:hypothetical protein